MKHTTIHTDKVPYITFNYSTEDIMASWFHFRLTSKKMYLYHSHISTQQSSSIGLLEKKCDLEMTFALFDISSDTCRSPNLEKKQNYILRNIYVSSKGWIILLKTDTKISKQIGYIFSNISVPIEYLMNRKTQYQHGNDFEWKTPDTIL